MESLNIFLFILGFKSVRPEGRFCVIADFVDPCMGLICWRGFESRQRQNFIVN